MKGFTLIELMIAIAIIGLLTSISIPVYTSYTTQATRANGMAELEKCILSLERQAFINNGYTGLGPSNADTGEVQSTICPLPNEFPYTLFLSEATQNTFFLEARTNTFHKKSSDGNLAVNHLGQRFRDKNNNASFTDSLENKWND